MTKIPRGNCVWLKNGHGCSGVRYKRNNMRYESFKELETAFGYNNYCNSFSQRPSVRRTSNTRIVIVGDGKGKLYRNVANKAYGGLANHKASPFVTVLIVNIIYFRKQNTEIHV